jgi:prepilin-type N-terminal cleavage/methylation domain-containing protein/prepilin-type processing-associated H-X9-DG protein
MNVGMSPSPSLRRHWSMESFLGHSLIVDSSFLPLPYAGLAVAAGVSIVVRNGQGRMNTINSRESRGCTLIELLVVISIVLILIALLFPALNLVEERANKTKCLTNCRQIAIAAQTLMGELGEGLPYRNDPVSWGQAADTLLPYVRNIEAVFDCPANPGNRDYPQCRMTSGFYVDYEMNGFVCQTPNTECRRQGMISDFSKVAYAYDYPYEWYANYRAHGVYKLPSGESGASQRQNDGVNCAYLDGHAAWLPDAEMGQIWLASNDGVDKFFLRGHNLPGGCN